MGAWDQFRLLFWKNFVLQKRRPFATVIELLLPLFFALLLVIIRQEIEVTNYPNVTTWSEFSVDNLPEFPYSVVPDDEHFNVAFMPNNSIAQNTATHFISFTGILPLVIEKLVSFASEDDFLIYVKNDTNLKKTLAGVVFTGDFTNNKFPNDVKITFRFHSDPISSSAKDDARFTGITDTWKTNLLFPDFQLPGPREPKSFEGGKPKYYAEGSFLALMHAVDMGLAQVLANTSGVDGKENMFLKRYPYPPYIMDTFVIAIQRTLPLLVMLSFFYTSLVIVRSVVHEKESKMKEYMMMMGLSNWLHWLAWFLKYLIFLAISCIGMAGFYKIQTSKGSVLTYSDVTLVFVFLFAFSAATITLCFLISVFFSKANVAAAAGGVLYGLTYMPYLFMQDNYSNLSHSVKLLSCLLSNVAMSNGCQLLGMFEGKGTGIQWYNIHQGVTVDDSFTLLEVILMLLFDTVLYMVLAVYIEGVWPGEYGIPKKWYFPFMKSYWLDTPPRQKYINIESTGENENEAFNGQSINGTDKEYFEDEPDNLRRVVEIKGLRKVFKSGTKEKVAVDNLSINMYEGQITVLLGHNGAGKTTTMSMLTGFFPPSSGEASIMGHNITDDMKGVRKSLGLCPQFNILFDLLTVDEHLYFFARLKGVPVTEVQQECDGMRDILKLNDKASAQSCTLSGGMKRKLSVGIALSAGSKYVILDEPTSGMDPAARRAIWDVLQIYRTKCSILLSTHFMDEADLLGDRIAIMADGRLRCTGSSVFLKSKFGVGYHVVLTKTPQCDVAQIDRFFLTHVPEAKLERTAGGEVSFVLPFHSSPSFPKLFRSLEEDADNLGITSFGATVTTIEEVFLRSLSGFLIAFNIVLGFSFLAASFAIFLVRERVDRSSLLQALAGVDPFCFWLSTFCWDFINFITPCLLTVIMFAVFSVSQFTDHAGIVILLFALYCWASLPLMYSLSLLFQVPSTALVRITIVNIITGLASIITVNVLRILGESSLNDVASSLDWAFLLLPQYCLGQGLADLYTNVEMVNICTSDPLLEIFCKEMGYNFQTNFLAWESYGVGRFVVFLATEGLIFFLILFIVEFDLLPRVWNSLRIMRNATVHLVVGKASPLLEDEDVAEERSRINSSELPNLVATDRLIIKNLRKVYKTGTRSHVAVDKLCIGIPEAECFGLLGINGAGKTTTFKMLTGDYRATDGTAYLDGYDIRTQLRMAQQRMGYCPQFDALIDQMTGAETLRMYARLRGVPEDEIQACVLNLGRILHFSEHIDKACGTYSGGNKRKLSTAIALVGSPPVVLLDEPSTGMDPGAKRMLWDALAAVRSSGCSIVITSHSMEECEALCTRLAIMVNGKLRCMGGPQHLKSKFGEGYVIEVKVKSNAELAKSQIEASFPGSTLKDEHQGMLTYHVPQCKTDGSDLKISMVFELMEESKSQSNIGDYTVSQTSLEQVFLGLVRWQRESTELYE
uniref:ABC transporter domain-containing protein n=1 Tax=Ciona savignyi TaxID=51511 RepID=H2Z853_CIOSA